MQLGHSLTRPGLTRLEFSLTVYRGFFCLLVCSIFIMLGNLLRGILFICCNQFAEYMKRKYKRQFLNTVKRYESSEVNMNSTINPLNADLNSIRHLLALLGAHLILHVSSIRVNSKYHVLYT
jgi:hypothetical protein